MKAFYRYLTLAIQSITLQSPYTYLKIFVKSFRGAVYPTNQGYDVRFPILDALCEQRFEPFGHFESIFVGGVFKHGDMDGREDALAERLKTLAQVGGVKATDALTQVRGIEAIVDLLS